METAADFIPSEEHHSHEGGLHEEGYDALDGERRAEDVADEPRIVAPVGSELELKDNSRRHTHGEIDSEELLPKTCGGLPERFTRSVITGFHNSHNQCQSQSERHKEPVIDCGKCELRPRPVYRSCVNVQ